MQPLVSVIVPTYKGADKICRAIDSILTQNYSNIEIIVVDDNGKGSAAQLETAEQLHKYADNEKFHYLIHEENRNGSAARNTAIAQAKGEYICFLDDDDVFMPEKCEVEVEKLCSMPEYGMVFGSVDEILPNGSVRHYSAKFEGDFLYLYLVGELIACSSTVMITRAALDKVGLWDESFRRHQDWEYFCRVADEFCVTYVEETCVRKFKYDNNLPKDGATTEAYRLHFLEKMASVIDKLGPRRAQRIRDHHIMEVGKVYLKNKDIKNALRVAMQTKSKLKTLFSYFTDGVAFLIRK